MYATSAFDRIIIFFPFVEFFGIVEHAMLTSPSNLSKELWLATHKSFQSRHVTNRTKQNRRNFRCNQSSWTWAKRIFDRFEAQNIRTWMKVKRAFKLFSMMLWKLFSSIQLITATTVKCNNIFLCCVTVHGYGITQQQLIPSSSASSLSLFLSLHVLVHTFIVLLLWVKSS